MSAASLRACTRSTRTERAGTPDAVSEAASMVEDPAATPVPGAASVDCRGLIFAGEDLPEPVDWNREYDCVANRLNDTNRNLDPARVEHAT